MSTTDSNRKALGRGISSLLPGRPPIHSLTTEVPNPDAAVNRLPIDRIEPNPSQPRASFNQEKLHELAQSIRENGVIQPLIVRKSGDSYHLIAGERRWRACRLAGLTEVPVVVHNFAEDRILEIALIENIQREDLNAIEIAVAFEKLATELNLSHEEIGRRTGKDRTTITNTLRLLKLPSDVQLLVAERRLSMGHARAILGLPDEDLQRQIAEKAASQGLSVRQVEQLVSKMTKARDPKAISEEEIDPNVKAALQALENALGTRVRLNEKAPGKGRLEIDYYSPEDLDRIYTIIVGEAPAE